MDNSGLFSSKDQRVSARLSRRDFLRIIAGIGIAGWVGKSILEDLEEARLVRQTRKLMGTIVDLTLIAPDRKSAATAEIAISACFDRMSALEALLSRFKPDSQVSLLNRSGVLREPHPAFLELLRQSCWVSELSSGLFDITILPVLALYQKHHQQNGSLPGMAEIEAASSKVDYRRLVISESELAFSEPGMGITLDGIAKGYIVDQGVSQLREHGFTDVLLEAGGDLIAAGRPGFDRTWKIGIRSPRSDEGNLVAELDISNQAVATSGDYMQSFTPDFSEFHILNPQTGCSSAALSSATVIAPNLALADALATTLMVMDPAKGLDLVRRLGLQSVLITKDGIALRE
jgi:thiamine biosynthesis lipoprotein